MPPIFTKTVTTVIVLFGLALALYAGISQSKTAFIVLAALLPVAWLLIVILVINNSGERRSANAQLRRFKYQVDLAKQQMNGDPKKIDQNVLKAFDILQDEIQSLLAQKRVRFKRLRQEILRFPFRTTPQQGTRWQPSTLSELGYVIGVSEKFSPATPLLALYKFSGEGRNTDGSVTDAFTIITESVPHAHAALFAAKVYAPLANTATTRSLAPAAPELASMPPPVDPQPGTAFDEDSGVGYALSLLGPITLSGVRTLTRNFQAIARLPADTAAPDAMPALMSSAPLRKNLRDLLTEKLEHSAAPLRMARHALRQDPQLLVCAIADASRDLKEGPAELLPALAMLAEILTPITPAARPALISLMTEWVVLVQSQQVIADKQPIVNPGVVIIEARGAETDAGFLERVAHWALPAAQQPAANSGGVIATTHLTAGAFHAQLRAYSEMQPGRHGQAVIDALEVALNVKKLALNTVDHNRPIKARELLHSPGKKPARWLLFSANPALVDLTGSTPPVQHVLWTLSSRALDAGSVDFKTLYGDRWQALVSHASRDSANA